MWDPPDNQNESIYPVTAGLRIGTTYTCTVQCPPQHRTRRYKLTVMDQADFESTGDEQRKKNRPLAPASLSDDGYLTGEFTPQADWPARVRVGFVDADGAPFGLGGKDIYDVV